MPGGGKEGRQRLSTMTHLSRSVGGSKMNDTEEGIFMPSIRS